MVVIVVRMVALVVVAVAVQLGLFKQEEEQQTTQQRDEELVRGACADSKASGSTLSKAVPSSTPADRLTRLCTMRPSTCVVRLAAANTDNRPPKPVARMM